MRTLPLLSQPAPSRYMERMYTPSCNGMYTQLEALRTRIRPFPRRDPPPPIFPSLVSDDIEEISGIKIVSFQFNNSWILLLNF